MKPILVVEDDDAIREMLRGVLSDEGYEVYCASNGRVALNLLTQIPRPCVILMDLMMPVMDGRELLAELKSDDKLARIPVTVVSAARDLANLDAANKVLRKPIHLDELLAVVASMIDDAPQSQEQREQSRLSLEIGRVSVPSGTSPAAGPMSAPQPAAAAAETADVNSDETPTPRQGGGGDPPAGDPPAF